MLMANDTHELRRGEAILVGRKGDNNHVALVPTSKLGDGLGDRRRTTACG